jgi:hypothetical protein
MKLIFSLIFILVSCIWNASAFTLVSQEVMQSSLDAPLRPIAKSVPQKDAPAIEVETPPLNGTISSPTAVRIKFQATAPSAIKTETFKVLYG